MAIESKATKGVKLAVAASVVMLAAGCSTAPHIDRIKEAGKGVNADFATKMDKFSGPITGGRMRRELEDEVATPYAAGDPVPLAAEVNVPHALRKEVSVALAFRAKSGGKTLLDLADAITEASDIAVRVKPDALLPAATFSLKTQGAAAKEVGDQLEIPSSAMPLYTILDRVANRMNVSWRFDGQAIEIYRVEPRSYTMRHLNVKNSTQAGLGRSAGQGGAFDNSSSTKVQGVESDPIANVKAAIEALMTRGGSGPVISAETGTIVVTDTPEAHAQIAKWLEQENKRLTRRVELVFEVVEMTVKNTHESAFDWSLVYNAVEGATANGSGFTSGGDFASTDAAKLSLVASGGKMAGSALTLKALADVGTVMRVDRYPLMTANRKPASLAVRTTFNYIDQVSSQATASSASVVSSGPTVQQKEETVGAMLSVVPDVGDDGVVTMSITYDNTSLTSLKPFTTGSGAMQTTVQQKTVDGNGTLQQIVTRIGVPTVIAGIERDSKQFDRRRLGDDVSIAAGGSDSARESRTISVVTVTAIARDGV